MVEILTHLDTAELELTIPLWYHDLVRWTGFDPAANCPCAVGRNDDGSPHHLPDCWLGEVWPP